MADLAPGAGGVQNGDRDIGKTDTLTTNRELEVRHCRVLLAVHDQGGVAAAARTLGLSQSTVSETLLALERVVGAPVTLRRPGKEAALTAAGETLLPHARALIAVADAALAAVAGRGHEIIRLGTVESISSFLLPEPLRRFRQRAPGADVRITIGLCEDLRRRVHRLELDAAITIESAGRAGDGSRVLAPMQLCLVVSPEHALARSVVGRAALAGHVFLLADPDGAFNGLLRDWLGAQAGAAKFESAGSIDGVKRGVRSGGAIGVLPAYAMAEELAAGALVALRVRETLPAIALLLTAAEPAAAPLQGLIEELEAALGVI
jgi:molybdate transport repressor ModE-like protein